LWFFAWAGLKQRSSQILASQIARDSGARLSYKFINEIVTLSIQVTKFPFPWVRWGNDSLSSISLV
jgi:hypothetical protein